ncbi:chemotaxis response regulator protein-glutamate methylesterase [bacterium]|nr:chemotaxis response regulator protein-glutamate methylesterase [bacterium]
MRIAIVNDLMLAVEILRRVISSVPSYEISWIAIDGAEAVKKCAEDTPDLILMDLIMPVMDGVQATSTIMKNTPCAILVVTATVSGNASKVFEAMGHGALDAAGTPVMGGDGSIQGADELLRKIATIGKLIGKNDTIPARAPVAKKTPKTQPSLVAIGSSTGGPRALSIILSSMPRQLGASIVIVQHVDVQFASGLAEWLNEQTALTVTVAREGDRPAENTVYIAKTNDHLIVGEDMSFHYTSEPRNYPYRPSVDTFFSSLAACWPQRGIALLLTGIGKDGARGLLELREKGWHTIAQDMKTSIVYGMPKAAAEIKAAVEILPIDTITESIVRYMKVKE